jgi:hypothetical protein
MPARKAFPSGELRVLKQQTSDVTAGLSVRPLDAEQIRYLWVSGIIQIGTVEAACDFTLIEYKLHIDETPWIIYSTLVNALETEFFEDFWDVVNYRRKGPTEFHDVAWMEEEDTYDLPSILGHTDSNFGQRREHHQGGLSIHMGTYAPQGPS